MIDISAAAKFDEYRPNRRRPAGAAVQRLGRTGAPLYRLDHLWPRHWVAAEGNGALKYRGRDPPGVVKAEKQREWAWRSLGLEVVRYDWELAAYRREEMAGRLGAVLEANPVRTGPVLWWPTRSPFVGKDGSLADEFVV